ncbi:MAG: AAA family ATPase, partial [Candidatus Gracilibacteria bacterium]
PDMDTDPMKVIDPPGDEEYWARKSTASKGRNVISSTSAARGCIHTDLPEDQVIPVFAKLGLQIERKHSLWFFYGTGERVASTFADAQTELAEISQRQGIQLPVAYLDTYSTDSTLPIDNDFTTIVQHMLQRCTPGNTVVSDGFFNVLQHPRVEIYVQKSKDNKRGIVQGKRVHVLSEFKSVINELRAGGAEKQYGRDQEMEEMLGWVKKFMSADVPSFSSFTIHGDAMMGKTRMAEEMIKAIRAIHNRREEIPKLIAESQRIAKAYEEDGQGGRGRSQARKIEDLQKELAALPKNIPYVIFVPAKDTRMGDSLSFFRTYAQQVLNAANDVFVDTPPDSCRALEKIASMDATTLAKEGPQILATALRRLRRSTNRFLIVTDDMQWADSESCDLLKQTFSKERQGDNNNFGHLALLNLTRTGDQVMNEELLQILQNAPNVGQLKLKPLPFSDAGGHPTPMLISFVCGLLKVNPVHTSIDAIVFEHLAKAAGGEKGNPGLLTEMIQSMLQEGVLSIKAAGVTYDERFMNWTAMGEADVMASARVDRLLASPIQKEVLRYIVFLRETGDCTFQFIANFFRFHLKRPDLLVAFGQLREQGVFTLQKIDSSQGSDNHSIIGFARDIDNRRLMAVLGNPALAQDEETLAAYKEIARFMFMTRDKMTRLLENTDNVPQRDAFLAILDRCSPYALYTMAAKADMREMMKTFMLDAFKDSYARGQFDVALSIYEYMKSEQDLAPVLLNFSKDIDLQLDLIQCMQVKRSAYAGEVEALGDRVRFYYSGKIDGLTENQKLSDADYKRIDRLHDLMCDFYFLRSSDPGVRKTSIGKLTDWGKGLVGYLAEGQKEAFPSSEVLFMDLKSRFHNMRGEYLMRHHIQACEEFFDLYQTGRDGFLHQYPQYADDIRFQRVDVEANRIFATAFNEGWNRVLAPGGDGYYPDLTYGDDDASEFASMFPDNSLRSNLETARDYFVKFFNTAREHPEFVPDRTQLYRSRKTLARIEGLLGNLESSMQLFFDARSDCVKYGDTERYADTLTNMSSPLCKMVQYYQATKDPAAAEQILKVAQLIERNEPGAVLSNKHHVATAAYFILQWAAHYSGVASTTFIELAKESGSPLHKFYNDVALVNLLSAVSTAAEAATFFGDTIDDKSINSPTAQLSFSLDDVMRRITQILPGEEKSFFDAHRVLDEAGNSDEFWSFYIAPFMARIMRHAARLQKYQSIVDSVVSPSDTSQATFAHAITSVAQEAASLTTENSFVVSYPYDVKEEPPRLKTDIPQYATVLEKKIADLTIADQRVRRLFPKKVN